jgi:hypothetical protein
VKRRRWYLLGVAVLALGGCGDESSEPAAAADVWEATPQSPLSPRESAIVIAVDDRLLVIGGSDAPPCPPHAECVVPEQLPLTDGASFDPTTGEWARIASAPVSLGGYIHTRTAVVGDTVYFLSDRYIAKTDNAEISFVAYDAGADAWTALPNPPGDASWLQLTAAGEHLIAYVTSHETMTSGDNSAVAPVPPDLLYKPTDQTWHALPADPHGPSFDRTMEAVDGKVILLGQDLVPNPGVDPPLVRMATLDVAGDPVSAKWTVLPDGEFLPMGYVSVGGLLISPHLGSADGGETNNWGREYPFGGLIDPETGEWRPFESVPAPDPDAWGIGPIVTGERTVISGSWAVDSRTLEWTRVPQHAQDADGTDVPLPTTNHAAALIDTTDGPLAFVWGGVLWADPDSLTSDYELLDDGWLWQVPTH